MLLPLSMLPRILHTEQRLLYIIRRCLISAAADWRFRLCRSSTRFTAHAEAMADVDGEVGHSTCRIVSYHID